MCTKKEILSVYNVFYLSIKYVFKLKGYFHKAPPTGNLEYMTSHNKIYTGQVHLIWEWNVNIKYLSVIKIHKWLGCKGTE